VTRASLHVVPVGAVATARHYLRDMVYGATDGIITTFAVVAGVAGGALSPRVALIIGAANLVADGLSMAVGNYLSIHSNEGVRRAAGLAEEESQPVRHAFATFSAFALAGLLPLLPYLLPMEPAARFPAAIVLTLAALFATGVFRAFVTGEDWRVNGLQMLGLGAAVAAVAYYAGLLIAKAGGWA
jgi:VIT1/CCC1 family predicted Fe2+/Mn2+ transporter